MCAMSRIWGDYKPFVNPLCVYKIGMVWNGYFYVSQKGGKEIKCNTISKLDVKAWAKDYRTVLIIIVWGI